MLPHHLSIPNYQLQSCGAPAGMDAQLCAARGGALGGLAALSALERGPLQRIALQALPCQGGFVGLYHGTPPSPSHHQSQCTSCGGLFSTLTQNACAGESCFRSEVSMIVTAQLLPCERPAIHAKGSGSGRVALRASLRSASPAIIAALQADMHAFFQELFEGRLELILLRPCLKCAQILSKLIECAQDLKPPRAGCGLLGAGICGIAMMHADLRILLCAGTATVGLLADGMPFGEVGREERQHSSMTGLAQLYQPYSSVLEQANGRSHAGAEGPDNGVAVEDALMQEWQRTRLARVQCGG